MNDPSPIQVTLPASVVTAIAEAVLPAVLERLSERETAATATMEYLTPVEAAELLRCSRQRIYDLLSAGRLRRYKDGSRVLLRRSEIESYVVGGT